MADKLERISATERSAIITVLDEFQCNLHVHVHAIKNEKKRCKSTFVNELLCDDGLWEELDMNLLSPEAKIEIAQIQEQALYEKLLQDCFHILNVIETLKKEILENGTFDSLSNEIKLMTKEAEEEKHLFSKCEESKKTVLELQALIDNEKIQDEETRKKLSEEFNEVRNNRIMSEQLSKIRERYAIAWTVSQKEQKALQLRTEVNHLEKSLNNYRIDRECDERYAKEMIKFLTQHIMQIEEKGLEWEERTEKEKQHYEIQIHMVRSEIRSRQQILEQLRKQYNERQEFIDQYLAEKEMLRLQQIHQALILQSTIKIQAWWRGIMVRRKLGPYKPDEKKKKKQGRTRK